MPLWSAYSTQPCAAELVWGSKRESSKGIVNMVESGWKWLHKELSRVTEMFCILTEMELNECIYLSKLFLSMVKRLEMENKQNRMEESKHKLINLTNYSKPFTGPWYRIIHPATQKIMPEQDSPFSVLLYLLMRNISVLEQLWKIA